MHVSRKEFIKILTNPFAKYKFMVMLHKNGKFYLCLYRNMHLAIIMGTTKGETKYFSSFTLRKELLSLGFKPSDPIKLEH